MPCSRWCVFASSFCSLSVVSDAALSSLAACLAYHSVKIVAANSRCVWDAPFTVPAPALRVPDRGQWCHTLSFPAHVLRTQAWLHCPSRLPDLAQNARIVDLNACVL